MLEWLAERYRKVRARDQRHLELAPLCEAASRGDVLAASQLIREFRANDDPELRKALSFQSAQAVRNEVARRWLESHDPRLAALLQQWGHVPERPPELHFSVSVLLDKPVRGDPDVYLPMLLKEPRAWHWVRGGLWQDLLFELAMTNQLPEGVRALLPGLPRDAATRAAYLLLADRLGELEELDSDFSLVMQAYETAGAGLRARLLAALRRVGRSELVLRNVRQELSLAEWHSQFDQLKSAGRRDEVWAMVGRLPPIWAAEALRWLGEQGFADPDFRALLAALPEDLTLTPHLMFTHEGVPLAWLSGRELLLTGPQLCQVDLKEVHQVTLPLNSHARSWRLSPDAARLAVIEGYSDAVGNRHFSLRLLRREVGNPILLSRPPQPAANEMAFSPDSRWLAAREDGMLRLFPVGGGAFHWELLLEGRGELRFLSHEELLFLTRTHYHCVDVSSGRLRWSVPDADPHPHVRGREEELLFFGDSRHMKVVNRFSGRLQGTPSASQQVRDAVLGPGGTLFAAGLTRLEMLDVQTGEVIQGQDLAHASHIRFAPDGFRLVRARGKVLELLDTHEGQRVGQIAMPGPVTQLDFSPDGLLLAVGLADRRTHILAMPPTTSGRLLSSDALQELERLSFGSPAWGFLYALARFRMRHAVTLDDFCLQDEYLIEVE